MGSEYVPCLCCAVLCSLQVVSDTIRSMLCPEAASAAEGAAATASSSTPRDAAASSDAAAVSLHRTQQLVS